MKKITYFMFMILGMILMVGNVDATTYAADPDWSAASAKKAETCGDFTSEVKKAKNTFSFDSSTGKFSVSGESGEDFMAGGGMQPVFFLPSEDGRTLYGYILEYNKWTLPFPEEWGQIPSYNCDGTFKIVKTSYPLSEEDPSDDNSSDNPSDNPSGDDSISDPDDDTNNSSNGSKTTKTYTNNGKAQQTTNNPNTGISPFLSLPAILGGGIAIVLRKKRIFG